jgi:hypothetical protein
MNKTTPDTSATVSAPVSLSDSTQDAAYSASHFYGQD